MGFSLLTLASIRMGFTLLDIHSISSLTTDVYKLTVPAAPG
jgi:hypothetical protein